MTTNTNENLDAGSANLEMPLILENGRKVYGPPADFVGTRPTYKCELYVTRIPQHLNEILLLQYIGRIGRVYEFRLMMDTGHSTRGYAFIRFWTEKEALAAYELLKFLFVGGGEDRLLVYRSQGKNRLFVSGIPRQIPLQLLEENFKLCFPQMQTCTSYPALKQCKLIIGREKEQNRGFAFIEFNDHEMALEAKKRLTPGRVRMWGVDLKVQWAKPREETNAVSNIKKINGVQSNNRVYPDMDAIPNDYCAKLRLYCLANNYCIPIIVYGPSFRCYQLQYAAILIKNSVNGSYTMFLYEVEASYVFDIHLLICELAVKMIERQSGLQLKHALFRVVSNCKGELVHTFETTECLSIFNLQQKFVIPQAIIGLATSLKLLAEQNFERLLLQYKRSFLTNSLVANFNIDDSDNPYAKFYSILPKFRNNTKLNNNFNDMEINLLQNPLIGQMAAQYNDNHANLGMCNDNLKYECFLLKSQNGFGIKYLLRYVDIMALEQRECYHKEQRVNTNPIWVAGQSYQKSIYN